jgi:HK97 gp10 family phage protein
MGAVVKITKNEFAEDGGRSGLVKSMTEALSKISATAKALCPVDYGQLRNSIMYKIDGKEEDFNEYGSAQGQGGILSSLDRTAKSGRKGSGKEQAASYERLTVQDVGRLSNKDDKYTGYVGTNSDHWYPEFGTKRMIAQPFLRPAKEIVIDGGKAVNIAAKYCREEMQKEYNNRKVLKTNE